MMAKTRDDEEMDEEEAEYWEDVRNLSSKTFYGPMSSQPPHERGLRGNHLQNSDK